MTPGPPGAARLDTPADVAAHVADWAAIVVTGPDLDGAARLAVAIACAASASRRVAIGDLAGELGPVYALAGGEDANGLAESFRTGLGLNEIARPVNGNPSLFVLPSGEGVRDEPALESPERWTRLIRGFGEAGGLLVLVVPSASRLMPVLGMAGAGLVLADRVRTTPPGITLLATVRTVRARGRPWWRIGSGRELATGVAAACVAGAALIGGAAGVAWIQARNAPTGAVSLGARPRTRERTPGSSVPAAPDTVALAERLWPVDSSRLAAFAVEVVAASGASNANSFLRERTADGGLPAATIAVVAVRNGPQRATKWHKLMVGAWHDARLADSALAVLRRRRVVAQDGGMVVRVPFAMLLADSASPERARAVMEVWRAKGIVPYALTQDDGTVRVYAGAFETVAQSVTMAVIVHEAGGTPMVAFRTGRPD